ncbi:hypothetical protein [Bradyrhizobium sp. CCGUVB23]|uniref:hypothetical protein n=1 Tax=Bradyrhizobium sp. CCGUVB23 TaxID=2949630 RepID=UPI0020B380A6|nr:hypothetical protein [Bradyrhizobium sp. CCGUVB23]MCP3459631.1 hypothetical protein [Bradyrhizobium sp. CCGUVB23]
MIRLAQPASPAGFDLAGFPAAHHPIVFQAVRSNLAAAIDLFLRVASVQSFLESACAAANPHDNAQQIVVVRMIRIRTSDWLIVPNRLDRLQFRVVMRAIETRDKRYQLRV